MEFVKYTQEDDTLTVKLTVRELLDLSTVIWGLNSTFPSQDPTIFLGVTEDSLDDLQGGIMHVIEAANRAGRKVSR